MLPSTQWLHRTMNFPSNQGTSIHTEAMQVEGATRKGNTWTKTTPHTFRFSQFACMFQPRWESPSAEYRLTAWWGTNALREAKKDDNSRTATAAETGGLCKTGCINWVYLPTRGQCFPPCVQMPLGCQSTDSGSLQMLWAS